MNKDYITITKDNGSKEQMEVVMTFRLEESNKDCIIYKDTNERYYAGYYNSDLENSELYVDFTDLEKEQLKIIFNELHEGDK